MGVASFHIPPKLLKFNYQYPFATVHHLETLYKEISQITSPLIISGSCYNIKESLKIVSGLQ